MVQQSTLRPIKKCLDCGLEARFIGPFYGRCQDCLNVYNERTFEEEVGRIADFHLSGPGYDGEEE